MIHVNYYLENFISSTYSSTINAKSFDNLGSDCGSVGRAVASDTRGPLFESSHQQNFIMNLQCANCWKDENKEKRGRGMAHFL